MLIEGLEMDCGVSIAFLFVVLADWCNQQASAASDEIHSYLEFLSKLKYRVQR